MAIYKLPKQFNSDFRTSGKRPVGEVEVDWSNPLSKYIYDYWLLDAGHPRSIVRNDEYVIEGTGAEIRPDGIRNTTSSYINMGNLPITDWDDLSIVIGYSDMDADAPFNAGFAGIGKNGTDDIRILVPSAPLDFRVDWDDGSFITQLFSVDENKDNVIAISHSASKGLSTTFANGVLKNSNADTLNTSGFNGEFNLGSSLSGARNKVPATFKTCIVFKKGTSSEVLKALTKNPYQILKPKKPAIYFTANDGGISITESLVNTNYTSLDPTITLTGTISITESVVNTNYASLAPTINLGGVISIIESLVNVNYDSLDPAIEFTGTVSIVENLVNTNYTSLDPTVTLVSTAIQITENTVDTQYQSKDPSVLLTPEPIGIVSTVCFNGELVDLVYNGQEVSLEYSGQSVSLVFSGQFNELEFNGTIQTTCNTGSISTDC